MGHAIRVFGGSGPSTLVRSSNAAGQLRQGAGDTRPSTVQVAAGLAFFHVFQVSGTFLRRGLLWCGCPNTQYCVAYLGQHQNSGEDTAIIMALLHFLWVTELPA